jgi:hypothetical protein
VFATAADALGAGGLPPEAVELGAVELGAIELDAVDDALGGDTFGAAVLELDGASEAAAGSIASRRLGADGAEAGTMTSAHAAPKAAIPKNAASPAGCRAR